MSCARLVLVFSLALWAWTLVGCGALPAGSAAPGAASVSGDDYIIVAVADRPEARPGVGAAVRGGYFSVGYAASGQALAQAEALAAEHGLLEVKSWTIEALRWRCMLYRLPASAARDSLLQRLASDPRVQLAQPLNSFETLASPGDSPPGYNDPYLLLQAGFAAIDAPGAQRLSRGEGVTVAVIDSHVDSTHPDLLGRVAKGRDFVGRGTAGDTHGTQVAGVIAAVANNGVGIAGVAPSARLLALRSCWAEAPGRPARCNSFTLALGLAAAMAAGADIVNLSLGGPDDPLLAALTRRAMDLGIVIVAALPASGRREGFPSALPGVLVVAASEAGSSPKDVLAAPGRQVLTLAAGGGYGYATGSSMASAHAAGALALLRARNRQLGAAELASLLAGDAGQPIDACRALLKASPGLPLARCGTRPTAPISQGPSAEGRPDQWPARP